MPFARPTPRATPTSSPVSSFNSIKLPGPSSSTASSTSSLLDLKSSSYNNTNPTSSVASSSLATPWNAEFAERQLEEMRVDALSASTSASSSNIPSPVNSNNNLKAFTFPAPSSISSKSNGNFLTPPAAPPQQMSRKQRLFQMSDDETNGVLESSQDNENAISGEEDDDGEAYIRAQKEALARMKAARADPLRRSISALSGVTVIGRGGQVRDREGSTSTLGSAESRKSIGSLRDQDDEELLHKHSVPSSMSSTTNGLPNVDSSSMNMSAALNLLSRYPGSAPAEANIIDNVEARFSHGDTSKPSHQQIVNNVMRNSDSAMYSSSYPQTNAVVLQNPHSHIENCAEGEPSTSTRARRHSRSSISERDRPFMPLSPVTPNAALQSPGLIASSAPTNLPYAITTLSNDPPSFGQFSFQNASSATGTDEIAPPSSFSRPPSISRRSSKGSDRALDGHNSKSFSGSRSASSSDLAQIMRSYSRPKRSPSRTSTIDLTSMSGNSAAPARSSSRINTPTSADLKTLIQNKRRQASAPFRTLASPVTQSTSLASPVTMTSPVMQFPDPDTTLTSAMHGLSRDAPAPARRVRSRRNTAAMSGIISLTPGLTNPMNGFEEARLLALRGMGQVVMTPSVEEWRQLGLSEDLNNRDGEEGASDEDSSDSSPTLEESDNDKPMPSGFEEFPRSRLGSIHTVNQYYGSLPPRDGMQRSQTSPELSRSSTSQRSNRRTDLADISGDSDHLYTRHDDEMPSEFTPRKGSGMGLPTLSRQSLSAQSGSPMPATPAAGDAMNHTNNGSGPVEKASDSYTRSISASEVTTLSPSLNNPLAVSLSRIPSPVPITSVGPIDPRHYSAVTGARNINSFAVVSEAGKGAYGLVRKVREIGPDGYPIGPDLMLKYIVKQRILSDAYKRHKVLGAIPMEIHVLDYIRRVYRPPVKSSGSDSDMESLSPSTAKRNNHIIVGHPNLCGMLDFFEDAENYYLVMACFGNGQDLFDYVDMAPTGLSIKEARSILVQIVDAIAFMHSYGIVHRDIKDENIILDGEGGVQLIDFGSAAYIKEGKPYFDTFSGTLDFASPEVLRGERYGGKEADIWALGVLAYVIMCGECPFWSSDESMAGLLSGCRAELALQAKAEETNANLQAFERGIAKAEARAAADFVHQCLRTHARDRPTAAQLKQHAFIDGARGWQGLRGWEKGLKCDSEED